LVSAFQNSRGEDQSFEYALIYNHIPFDFCPEFIFYFFDVLIKMVNCGVEDRSS